MQRLWYMNADCEMELAAWPSAYTRIPTIERRNRRLARALLWIAEPGDAILVDAPWDEDLGQAASARGVELVATGGPPQSSRLFTPWGWTPSAVAAGERAGAVVRPLPFDAVARANSKLFSHAIERELGIDEPGAAAAATLDELQVAVARACPGPRDKWVVKTPLGFTARGRVLGRGPRLDPASATWAARRFDQGETLLFEPWLSVVREYGVQFDVSEDGLATIHGISDLQTNRAGAATGYLLGRHTEPYRVEELERTARAVASRLADAGYTGPAGIDALETEQGLRPLLEINARITMGRVALAAERALAPRAPRFWHPLDVSLLTAADSE